MLPVLLTFVQPVFHAFCDVWNSRLMNKVFGGPIITLFFVQATLLVMIPFLFFFGTPGSIGIEHAALIAGSLVIDIAFMSLYLHALKFIDVSVSQVLWNLGDATIPFLALALFGERISNAVLVGFFMLLAASVFLSADDFRRPRLGRGFWLIMLVAALYSAWLLLNKHIIGQIGWLNMTFYYRIGWVVAATLFFISAYGRKEVRSNWSAYKRNFKPFMLYAFFSNAAFFSQMFALGALPLAVKEGISSTQPFFVLAWAWIFARVGIGGAKEDMSAGSVVKKIICFTLMLIGVILLV